MNLLNKGLLSVWSAMLLTAGVPAQVTNRTGLAYFQNPDHDYWDQTRLEHEYRGAFYDRLHNDLDVAERAGYLRGGDYKNFTRAHKDVAQFQEKWSRGVFDPHEMDSAIAAVQHVLDIPTLRTEDRDPLREDLFNMRRFRAHMEGRRY